VIPRRSDVVAHAVQRINDGMGIGFPHGSKERCERASLKQVSTVQNDHPSGVFLTQRIHHGRRPRESPRSLPIVEIIPVVRPAVHVGSGHDNYVHRIL
jgi:hypothetical protein